MERFRGMMPKDEVKIEKIAKYRGFSLRIQAGPNGWAVIDLVDKSVLWGDNVADSKENFKLAIEEIKKAYI